MVVACSRWPAEMGSSVDWHPAPCARPPGGCAAGHVSRVLTAGDVEVWATYAVDGWSLALRLPGRVPVLVGDDAVMFAAALGYLTDPFGVAVARVRESLDRAEPPQWAA